MADLVTIGERDRWICWLCDRPVVPGRSGPDGPTLDHVQPRSRGGKGHAANLRLAHRRCNAGRGSAAPELSWPDRFNVVDHPALWSCLRRLTRRPGTEEVVAIIATDEAAAEAAVWVQRKAADVCGGNWSAESVSLGGVPAVRLTRLGA